MTRTGHLAPAVANSPFQIGMVIALKIANAEWRRDHRRLLVPNSVDEGSAFDWRPTAKLHEN